MNPIDAIRPRWTVHEFGPFEEEAGAYYAELTIEPAVGDPYRVELLITLDHAPGVPRPVKRVRVRSRTELTPHQVSHYGGWIGTIAAQLLADHGVDPGPPVTVHEGGGPCL